MSNTARSIPDNLKKARDRTEESAGYSSSAESVWTRQAARGQKVETTTLVDTSTMSRLELLIHRTTKDLINLQMRVSTERDPTKVLRNIGIKKKFLDRLRAEQRR